MPIFLLLTKLIVKMQIIIKILIGLFLVFKTKVRNKVI